MDGVNDQAPYTSVYGVPPSSMRSRNLRCSLITTGRNSAAPPVTNSGTNEMHGSFWEYLRNNAWTRE
jgi:hypothetical protein